MRSQQIDHNNKRDYNIHSTHTHSCHLNFIYIFGTLIVALLIRKLFEYLENN